MTSPAFVIAVGPASGSAPTAEITDWTSWSLEDNLDDGASMTFSCRGNSQGALAIDELASDVWLYQDSVLIYRFRIVAVEQTWGPDGDDDISVQAIDYRRLLKARVVGATPVGFVSLAQGDIIWGLIDYSQTLTNGNLGITLGGIGPVTPAYDRLYPSGTNIFDAIQEFGQLDQGVVWKIDENLVLYVTAQFSFPTNSQPIILGVNAFRMTRPSSSVQFANVSVVTGNTQVLGAASAVAPTLSTDPRGRWEKYQSFPNETDSGALQLLADGLVQSGISPAATWTIEMEPTRYFYDSQYETGDLVTIVQPRSTVYPVGTPAPSISGQILSRSISEDSDGNIQVVVTAVEIP